MRRVRKKVSFSYVLTSTLGNPEENMTTDEADASPPLPKLQLSGFDEHGGDTADDDDPPPPLDLHYAAESSDSSVLDDDMGMLVSALDALPGADSFDESADTLVHLNDAVSTIDQSWDYSGMSPKAPTGYQSGEVGLDPPGDVDDIVARTTMEQLEDWSSSMLEAHSRPAKVPTTGSAREFTGGAQVGSLAAPRSGWEDNVAQLESTPRAVSTQGFAQDPISPSRRPSISDPYADWDTDTKLTRATSSRGTGWTKGLRNSFSGNRKKLSRSASDSSDL